MSKRSILFLGTAASIPNPRSFTQSVAICGTRECALLDAGEGVQIRLANAGIDHRNVKIVAISHIHGDHIHGVLPLIESLGMKIASQGSEQSFNLKMVGPRSFCEFVFKALEIIKVGELDKIVGIECIEAGTLFKNSSTVESPGKELVIKPIPVYHGLEESYGYYVDVKLGKNSIGVYYSGDGICKDVCIELLKRLKPLIVIHEATFLDYPEDEAKAVESFHSTVKDAAKVASIADARILVLTHISARYRDEELRNFVSRAKRFFSGDVFVAEDLSKIPLDIVKV